MTLTSGGTKIWLAILLFELYHLIIWLVAFLNTAVWITEHPHTRQFHQHGLYQVVHGFNVFFALTILIAIVILAFKIGDYILSIADLRIRANYNFALLMFSLVVVILVPILFMYTRREYLLVRPEVDSFLVEVLVNFAALDAAIIFVLAIFLLLTALLSTMRSYNTFRYLIRVREERKSKRPPLPPQPAQTKSILKPANRVRIPPEYRAMLLAQIRRKQSGPSTGSSGTPYTRYPLYHRQEQQPNLLTPSTSKPPTPGVHHPHHYHHYYTPSISGTSSASSKTGPLFIV